MKEAVKTYLKQFKKLGRNAKILIIAILIGSFFIGIAAQTGYQKLTYQPQPPPSPTSIPAPASISLTSNSKEIETGATFSATIKISSPNQGVEAADFVVSFDPDYLKVATVSSGNFFGVYPVKKAETNSVKISGMANLIDNKIIIPKGEGTIGNITFEALAATESTKISFDKEKTIVANGGKNILGEISDLQISIK